MPSAYLRSLTGKIRSGTANRQLGFVLAFIAGAINAGGFLAVATYTSHMTGIVSAMADDVALGQYWLALGGMVAVMSFTTGAAFCAILINYGRRHDMNGEYALPLLVEAVLLMVFGIIGANLTETGGLFTAATVVLLCFIMGLQNAVITKISGAVIRTTHITGIMTDIGIELGKLVYRNMAAPSALPPVLADRDRLSVLSKLAILFFVGGLAGAIGFKVAGYVVTLPLALTLLVIAVFPVIDDLRRVGRR